MEIYDVSEALVKETAEKPDSVADGYMAVQEKNRDIIFLYAISDQIIAIYRTITWVTLTTERLHKRN